MNEKNLQDVLIDSARKTRAEAKELREACESNLLTAHSILTLTELLGAASSPPPETHEDALVRGIRSLILLCNPDPDPEILDETPARFLKAMLEQCDGYDQDPAAILAKQFDEACDEMIVVSGIHFNSLCEHHLLPFVGTVTVAYIPSGRVAGLSKIPRLVDCFAHRLQLQERLTNQIADALNTHLNPLGVGVIVCAHHQCMSCRGVRKQDASMITSALRGLIKEEPEARAEFLKFANGSA
jgi:GTP cyclohydrolase I